MQHVLTIRPFVTFELLFCYFKEMILTFLVELYYTQKFFCQKVNLDREQDLIVIFFNTTQTLL